MSEQDPLDLDRRLRKLEREMREVRAQFAGTREPVSHVPPAPVPPGPPVLIFEAAEQPMGRAAEPIVASSPLDTEPPGTGTANQPTDVIRTSTPVSIDWEQVVGRRGALWMGAALVFLAMAFFLSWAWQSLGPWGRVTVGALVGAAFVGAGEWASDRKDKTFSAGLAGAGLAILYLDIWAAVQRESLLGMETGLALMALFVAAGVALAVRYNVQALSLFATVGGYLTPGLLAGGGAGAGSPVPLLGYLTALNAGVLAVSLYKSWPSLTATALVADILVIGSWVDGSYRPWMYGTVFTFATVHFLLFAGAAVFRSLIRGEEATEAQGVLLAASALVYFAAGQATLSDHLGGYRSALAIALTAVFAAVAWGVTARARENDLLRRTALGLAALFATIIVPLQLREHWIAIGWSVLFTVFAALQRGRDRSVFLPASGIVWVFALVLTAGQVLDSWNSGPMVVSGAGLALLAFAIGNAMSSALVTPSDAPGQPLRSLFGSVAIMTGAVFVGREAMVFLRDVRPAFAQVDAGPAYVAAMVLSVYAVAAYAVGIAVKQAPMRFSAVTVAAVSLALAVLASLGAGVYESAPFGSVRFVSYVVVGASLAMLGWMATRYEKELGADETGAMAWIGVTVNGLALWAVSLEIAAAVGPPENASSFLAPAAALFISALWSAYALGVSLLGTFWERAPLRYFGYLDVVIGLMLLVEGSIDSAGTSWTPVFNPRFLAFLVATGALLVIALLDREDATGPEREVRRAAGYLTALVALWGLTQETYHTVWTMQASIGESWPRVAQMSISVLWTAFGALLLSIGIHWRSRTVRLMALGLLGITSFKVFLVDLGFLDTPYRVLSFGALGLTLIGISWLYTRYGIGEDQEAAIPPPIAPAGT